MTARKDSRPPARAALVKSVTAALDDMKAVNIKVLDVRGVTDVADCMVIASGTSDRHVRSIAERVVERAKAAGFRPFGVEGDRDGEWVLVDLNDVIVHVMLPRVREFYGLESLWEVAPKPHVRKPKPRAKTAKTTGKPHARPAAKSAAGRSSAVPRARPKAKSARPAPRKASRPKAGGRNGG
jgi:ribosome silencing factor RsfS/YbeB/iojap